jgi:PKD repeat protein
MQVTDGVQVIADTTPVWADAQLRVSDISSYEVDLWAADYITEVTEVRLAATLSELDTIPWSPYSEITNTTRTWDAPIVFARYRTASGKESEVVSSTVEAITFEPIQAAFAISPTICAGVEPYIANESFPLCEQCNWHWDFGNNTTSESMEPLFNYGASFYTGYQTPGTYTITLTATSLFNTSSAAQQVEVLPTPSSSFTIERSGPTIIVRAEDTMASNWTWNFGDGSTASGSSIAAHTYTDTLFLTNNPVPISLTVEDTNGCASTSIQYLPHETRIHLPLIVRGN